MREESTQTREGTDERPVLPVDLPAFSGPLDLLLHLVRRNKVDITDIPIVDICDQYHATLRAMAELDLEVAGEFLWMASWLLYLKSRTLLPTASEEGVADPRAELVERLLEYRRVKEMAAVLYEHDVVRRCLWGPVLEPTMTGPREIELDWEDVDLRILALSYLEALQRFAVANPPPMRVAPLRFTVGEKMRELYRRVLEEKMLPLRRLLRGRGDAEEVVTLVVAALELARLGGIVADQRRAFAEIYLRPGARTLDVDALLQEGIAGGS
jgi:segregation and condensation protein A